MVCRGSDESRNVQHSRRLLLREIRIYERPLSNPSGMSLRVVGDAESALAAPLYNLVLRSNLQASAGGVYASDDYRLRACIAPLYLAEPRSSEFFNSSEVESVAARKQHVALLNRLALACLNKTLLRNYLYLGRDSVGQSRKDDDCDQPYKTSASVLHITTSRYRLQFCER